MEQGRAGLASDAPVADEPAVDVDCIGPDADEDTAAGNEMAGGPAGGADCVQPTGWLKYLRTTRMEPGAEHGVFADMRRVR